MAEFPVNNGEIIWALDCPFLTPNLSKAISYHFIPIESSHSSFLFWLSSFSSWSSQAASPPSMGFKSFNPRSLFRQKSPPPDDLSNLAFPSLTTIYTLYSPPVLPDRIPPIWKKKKSVCSLDSGNHCTDYASLYASHLKTFLPAHRKQL